MLKNFPATLPPLKDTAPFIVIGSGVAGLYSALELSKVGQGNPHYQICILNESNTYLPRVVSRPPLA